MKFLRASSWLPPLWRLETEMLNGQPTQFRVIYILSLMSETDPHQMVGGSPTTSRLLPFPQLVEWPLDSARLIAT
jgi:hypothetical protein